MDAVAKNTQTWDGVEKLARLGYGAKGVVYGLVGVLAMQAAITASQPSGSRGALSEIAAQPFGRIILGVVALGLVGYVVWRAVQALWDADDKGSDAKGIAKRIGFGVSAVSYGLLAVWAGALALGVAAGSGGGSGGSGGSASTATGWLMSQPFGTFLVGVVGAIIIGVGLHHFKRVYEASFMKQYNREEMSSQERRAALAFGRAGLTARGITFGIIGGFVTIAAAQSNPEASRGLGGALQSLANQPYGPWLLGAVAVGLICYGAYCFSRARYREITA